LSITRNTLFGLQNITITLKFKNEGLINFRPKFIKCKNITINIT